MMTIFGFHQREIVDSLVLAVWAGYYLDGPAIEKSALQPYIQEALDELEFLTGPVSSKYGSMRAKLGYLKPWKIKYVEIGNEDNLGKGGPSYKTYRFAEFYRAIKEKYNLLRGNIFSKRTNDNPDTLTLWSSHQRWTI
jgi:alpha-L-arabinofuranosidase